MAADLLQQLRDIHVPEDPGWWPPAPGWWLLAALVLALAGWVLHRLWQVQRRRRPIRRARVLYADIHLRHQRGELTTRDYLNQSNELLKRLLIHGLGEQDARRATGQDWLEVLDRHLDEPAFTAGPGAAFGDERFRPELQTDTAAVHELVQRVLQRATPSPWSRP